MLVGKMSRSTDAVVRATCSSALGLLLKSSSSLSWREAQNGPRWFDDLWGPRLNSATDVATRWWCVWADSDSQLYSKSRLYVFLPCCFPAQVYPRRPQLKLRRRVARRRNVRWWAPCKFTWMDCVFWCSNPWSFACFGMSVAWSGVWTPPATSSDAELPLFNKGDFRAQVWSQIAFHVTAGSSDTDLFDYGVYRKRRLQPLRMCLEWCSARPAVIKQVIGWGGRNQWREPLGNRDTVRAFTWGAHQSQAAIKTRQWHYRKCVRADRVTPSHLFIITHLHCWVC